MDIDRFGALGGAVVRGIVSAFNSDLFWDTSGVTSMIHTFQENSEFRGDLSTWDVREVNNMTGMFSFSGLMDSGIGNWALTSLTRATSMVRESAKQRA